MSPALKQRMAATAADQVVARLDGYSQDQHHRNIQAARERNQRRRDSLRQAAREAAARLRSAS